LKRRVSTSRAPTSFLRVADRLRTWARRSTPAWLRKQEETFRWIFIGRRSLCAWLFVKLTSRSYM